MGESPLYSLSPYLVEIFCPLSTAGLCSLRILSKALGFPETQLHIVFGSAALEGKSSFQAP